MTEMVWHDREPRRAWAQMAIDLAMVTVAEAAGIRMLRIYSWEDDTLSLGANESALRTWDRTALERDGVPCVRRPSGGRGVWHRAEDLTYAWAGPSGGLAGVRHRYRDLHDRLGAAMASCGVATMLAASPTIAPGLAPGGCFDVAVGGEVLVAGRKTIGSAQKVIGRMLLQHGAIALDEPAAVSRYRVGAVAAAQSSQHQPLPDAGCLAEAIVSHWWADGALPAPDEVIDRVLVASRDLGDRFRDPAWTWRR